MDQRHVLRVRPAHLVTGVLVFAALYLARLYSYLLFHSIAEFFSVAVAFAVFMVVWNARRSMDNPYILFVGIAYLFAAATDSLHLLSYKGMGVFAGSDANLPTQLWIAARYIQSVSLLIAPLFAGRAVNHRLALGVYAAGFSLLAGLIFYGGIFPDCFIEGEGLTPFKIYSEYAICLILLAAAALLIAKREFFDADVLRLLVLSIAAMVCAELSFTLYKKDVYGLFNLIGHFLKILSFYLFYRAVIGTDLVRKYDRLLRDVQDELSRRRKTEGELRESEERFRALVEHTPASILIVQDGRIVFQNPEQKRLFGPVPDGLAIREFRDVHPEDAGTFERFCEAVSTEGGRAVEIDFRLFPYGRAAEGLGMRWVHCRTSPIEYMGRKAVLASMVDVTRAKELEQLVRVREKMASLGHVSAGIAHEIRNPLSGINIYVSTVEQICEQSEGLEPGAKEEIQTIVRQVKSASNKIASVIRRVMDFVKPTPPCLDRVNLNNAVEEAVQLSQVAMRERGIALETSLSPDLPACLADLHLIEQVLLNVISNAAQAMEGRAGVKRIEVGSSMERDRVVLRVSDSGPGVPLSVRDKIFDPFFTTRKEGYGIGLSFSHRVVTDHGGFLTVGTSRWGGAEFRIEIPVAGDEVTA